MLDKTLGSWFVGLQYSYFATVRPWSRRQELESVFAHGRRRRLNTERVETFAK